MLVMVCCSVHLFSHVLLPSTLLVLSVSAVNLKSLALHLQLPAEVQNCWESVVSVSHPVCDINPSNYLGELHLPWQQKLRVHGCCVNWAAGCKLKWLLIWGKPDSPWSYICGCRCSSLRTDTLSTGIYNYAKGQSWGDKTVKYTVFLHNANAVCNVNSCSFTACNDCSHRQNICHF